MNRRYLLLLMAGLAVGLPDLALAQTRQPSAAGLWQQTEDGRPVGWFRITEKGGVYEGQIVRMFPKTGEDPASFRCTKCTGARKNAPVLGITFITGMRREGLRYEDGKILDPRDGTVYDALMELSPDGRQLTVRGYVGVALFGKSQLWTRLPDDAMGTTGSAPPRRR